MATITANSRRKYCRANKNQIHKLAFLPTYDFNSNNMQIKLISIMCQSQSMAPKRPVPKRLNAQMVIAQTAAPKRRCPNVMYPAETCLYWFSSWTWTIFLTLWHLLVFFISLHIFSWHVCAGRSSCGLSGKPNMQLGTSHKSGCFTAWPSVPVLH